MGVSTTCILLPWDTKSFRLFLQHVTTAVVPTYLGTFLKGGYGNFEDYPYPLGQRNTIHIKDSFVLYSPLHVQPSHVVTPFLKY